MGSIEIVQAASRTTTGTQDFTVAGFGTPKGALFYVTSCLTNGTVANHALFCVGMTDGTNQFAVSCHNKDGIVLGNSLVGSRMNTVDCLFLADQDGTVLLHAQFSATITDGIRISFSVAPASAYLITCVLLGGSGVTNAYVNTVATPTVVDTGTTVSTVPFTSDVILTACNAVIGFTDVNTTSERLDLGFCVNDGTTTPPQYSLNWSEVNNATTTSVLCGLDTNSVSRDIFGSNNREAQIQSITSTGFTAFLKVLGTAATTFGYMALKLGGGLIAKAVQFGTPTSGGAHDIAVAGIVPNWGMLFMSAVQVIDQQVSTADAEVFAVSVFNPSTQYCMAITSDDAVAPAGTTNCESVVHSQPVFLRKDSATFMDATLTSFSADTATFNFGTANGTTRQWAGLFIGPLVVDVEELMGQMCSF